MIISLMEPLLGSKATKENITQLELDKLLRPAYVVYNRNKRSVVPRGAFLNLVLLLARALECMIRILFPQYIY